MTTTTTHAPQCTAVTQRQKRVLSSIDPTAIADLWIGNTEWAYEIVRDIAMKNDTAGIGAGPLDTVGERGDRIKDFMVEQFLGEDSPIAQGKIEFFVTDLVQAAIATIDYRELVERYSEP